MELFHKSIFRLIKHTAIYTALLRRPLLEMLNDIVVNIIKGECRERKIVPRSTALTHQKRFKRRTCQHLFCTSAAVIVYTLTGYAYGICRNINFNVVLTAFSQEIDANDNAHRIPHFVRNIFEELTGVAHQLHFPRHHNRYIFSRPEHLHSRKSTQGIRPSICFSIRCSGFQAYISTFLRCN